MKLEKAIKQTKPFKDAHQKAMVNLIFTSSWLNGKQKDFFAKYSLTIKQYNILRILRGAEKPISTATIRERMLDKMSDASRIVDRLEKKGLVNKTPSLKDQRKVDVSITKTSNALLSEIDKEIIQWTKSFSGLTLKEANLLSDLLDKMRK